MNAHLNETQKNGNDASYCKFGFETLLKLLDSFENQIDGVIKGDDIECVHKMRVASRRMRAALPLFRLCFSKRKFKKWLLEIKNVTCLLSEARDLDVQIAFIEQYLEALGSSTGNIGVDLLLKDKKIRRSQIHPSVVRGLQQLKAYGFTEDIQADCESTLEELSALPLDFFQVLEKAKWRISFRLDDFLAMEKWVRLENEILKHHEMRICAKKLRYTMEVFAPLYKNKLVDEIGTMKTFQDVLGEMHDYDVWIAQIPKFTSTSKNKIETAWNNRDTSFKAKQDLLKFLTYVKEKRKDCYQQFVNLWDKSQKNNFFGNLRKVTNMGSSMENRNLKLSFSSPQVKIAVLSDIHANLQALQCVIRDAEKHHVDVFLNAGDSVGFGGNPNEVVELMYEKDVISILGNYDLEVIEGKSKAKGDKKLALDFARNELAKSCEDYLYSLPRELRFEAAGKKLLVVHGSPESIEEHIYHDTPEERLKTLAQTAQTDVIIMGHSHDQFMREKDGVCFINPGSVGRSGDGNPQTAYAILSFNPLKVDLVRLDYDVEAAANALRKKRLPESFAQMLLRGVSIDTIIEEDSVKEDKMAQSCREIVKTSEKISQAYWQDTKHYKQVAKLALALFDQLDSLHQLGKRERCWLECAAILHDVGLSRGRGSHHKNSAMLILNDTRLPFASQERRIIASIARYHRKNLPKKSHYNLAALDRSTFQKINLLSGLLRVADGLDYTHQSIVKHLSVKVGTKKITAECVRDTLSTLEEQAFNKKKDLFEKVFRKKLVLVWKQQ